jgi:hypothetical protein
MTEDQSIFDEESAMMEQLARADAGFEEDLPKHLRRLSDGYGNRLTSLYPQGYLIDEVTRSLVSAGVELHDCAARNRTGGVCLTPSTAVAGVIVTWTVHDVLAYDHARCAENVDVHEIMNYALADVLRVQGWVVEPFGEASAHRVTGRAPTTRDPAS